MTTRAILLDIEGTTTSIRFVYDTLFPFARAQMAAFLQSEWHAPTVQDDVAAIRTQARQDLTDGVDDTPQVPEGVGSDARQGTLDNVLWQMDSDRKTTGLKALQGKVWKHGYASGELRGHIYDDVVPSLNAWQRAGVPVYIYSSGSVAAQKLLFTHSAQGDLTPLLAGYFDTTTGPKKQATSYSAIAASIACAPEHILFATDNLEEAIAAAEAGLQTVVSIRPGNPPLPDHGHRVVTSLDQLL